MAATEKVSGNMTRCQVSSHVLDETFGRCCGGGDAGMGCGGYVGGKPALEHYKDGLFGEPRLTTWTRGQPAEVFWASGANHMGGYAYRLCKVNKGKFWKVTEECFNKGHLNFYGAVLCPSLNLTDIS